MSSVNKLRHKIFLQRFEKEKKVIDISLLPPCETNLKLHIIRANYVASIFRKANHLILDLDESTNHGWDERGEVVWSSVCFSDDVSGLLGRKYKKMKISLIPCKTVILKLDDFDDVMEEEEGLIT